MQYHLHKIPESVLAVELFVVVEEEYPFLHNAEQQDPELAGQYKQAMEMLANKELDLVINIPKNFSHRELTNGYHVRRAAIDFNIPLITNARLATAFIRAFCAMSIDDIQIKSWDQY